MKVRITHHVNNYPHTYIHEHKQPNIKAIYHLRLPTLFLGGRTAYIQVSYRSSVLACTTTTCRNQEGGHTGLTVPQQVHFEIHTNVMTCLPSTNIRVRPCIYHTWQPLKPYMYVNPCPGHTLHTDAKAGIWVYGRVSAFLALQSSQTIYRFILI